MSAEPGEGERPKALIPHACTIPSREPHRSLTVAPLIGNQRCYGEATVRVWRGSGRTAWGSACGRERGAVPLKTAKSQKLHHKCLNRRDLSPLHGTATRPPPGRIQNIRCKWPLNRTFPTLHSAFAQATPRPLQGHFKAPTRRVDSQGIGTPKPPQGYPKAPTRLQRGE